MTRRCSLMIDERVYVMHGCGDIYLTELTADARAVAGPDAIYAPGAYGAPMEGSHIYKRGRLLLHLQYESRI